MKTIFIKVWIMIYIWKAVYSVLIVVTILLIGCTPAESDAGRSGDTLQIVATTSIVADVVAQVAGEQTSISILLPPNSDPHSYQPTAQDITTLSKADVIFANGAGLEVFLEPILTNADSDKKIVYLSENINLLTAVEHNDSGEAVDQEYKHNSWDPHVWMNPNNVIAWVKVIQSTLGELDPPNAATYQRNAQNYISELNELDGWISTQVAEIPVQKRILVMDHLVLGYFAEEYGFQQAGAVIPGFSTIAEPSAQQLAEIIDTIDKLGVSVIFVSDTAPQRITEPVADDTGSELVYLYTGSLTERGGPASNYIDYMRYNVKTIVEALR
jgi:ABC-type Zn uptake system ZnuABC Zn-binding protein ZnuA